MRHRTPLAFSRVLSLCMGLATAAPVTGVPAVATAQPATQPATQPAAPPERALTEVVSVTPGATCLELERLLLRVARWRERDTVDARIQVAVRGDPVSPTSVTFTVTRSDGGRAARTLSDAPQDCDQLHSAVSLSIALAIDATLTDGGAALDEPIPEPVAAAPVPPIGGVPPTAAEPDPRAELELSVGAALGLVSLDAALGAETGASLRLASWLGVSLTGLLVFSGDQSLQGTPGSYEATLLAIGPDVCLGGEASTRFELWGCGGARAGAFLTSGRGYDRDLDRGTAWWALSAGLHAHAFITSAVAVGLHIQTIVPLAERAILVRSTSPSTAPAWRDLPRVGVLAMLGPVFRIF